MKKFTLVLTMILIVGILTACSNTNTPQGTDESSIAENEVSVATEKAFISESVPQTKQLSKGTMQVYDFGTVKLHSYSTNDALGNQSFLIETDTALIGIEAPAFNENLTEYIDYINEIDKPMNDILISYHPTGGDTELYENMSVHATSTAKAAIEEGGSVNALTKSFVEVFGEAFNANIVNITDVINTGTVTIGGLDFVISNNGDGYDIEIPAINCVYTHMMGSDVHNILTSTEHVEAMIAQMKSYKDKGIYLVLTSHYAPEKIDKVAEKITYLEKAKELISISANGEEFITAMKEAFPEYGGDNYLEMSASMISFK